MYPFVDEHQLEKMYSDITGQALLHSAVAQFDIEDVKIFLKTVLMRISNMRAVFLTLTRSTFRERQSTCILQKSHGLRKKTNWATSASSERVSSICHLRAAQIDWIWYGLQRWGYQGIPKAWMNQLHHIVSLFSPKYESCKAKLVHTTATCMREFVLEGLSGSFTTFTHFKLTSLLTATLSVCCMIKELPICYDAAHTDSTEYCWAYRVTNLHSIVDEFARDHDWELRNPGAVEYQCTYQVYTLCVMYRVMVQNL